MQLWHTTGYGCMFLHSWWYYILWSKICEIFNLFIHFLCTLDSLFLVFFLAPTFLESINGKNMFLDGCKENSQQPQLSLIVILLYCKRPSSDIGIDVAIAKEPSLISILILLLQNTLQWYWYWYCYCKTPSAGIDIDVAIAQHPRLLSISILLLHTTCHWRCYCYCYW